MGKLVRPNTLTSLRLAACDRQDEHRGARCGRAGARRKRGAWLVVRLVVRLSSCGSSYGSFLVRVVISARHGVSFFICSVRPWLLHDTRRRGGEGCGTGELRARAGGGHAWSGWRRGWRAASLVEVTMAATNS